MAITRYSNILRKPTDHRPQRLAGYLKALALIAGLSPAWIWAQWNELSPYSRMGLGLSSEVVHTHQNGMGGVSSTVFDPFAYNPGNPASAALLSKTTLQGTAAVHGLQWVGETQRSNGTWGTTGPMSFVVKRQGGPHAFQLGLAPSRTTGYLMAQNRDEPGVGPVRMSYEGSGGINQATMGWARSWRRLARQVSGEDTLMLAKTQLAVGAQWVYFFGQTEHKARIDVADPTFLDHQSELTNAWRGLSGELGIQLEHRVGKQLPHDDANHWQSKLLLGGTYRPRTNLSTDNAQGSFLTQTLGGIVVPIDTAFYNESAEATSVLPQRWTVGVGWLLERNSGQRAEFHLDYKMQDWSAVADLYDWNPLGTDMAWGTAQSVHIGVAWSPSMGGNRALASTPRTYRLGFARGQEAVLILGNPLEFQRWTLGASLPLGAGRSWSRIHFGMELGKRWTSDPVSHHENLIRFEVGVSLSPFFKNNWLVRRLYD